MGISVGGLFSGLDVDNIVSQLVEVERRPIKLLELREESYQVKLSSYGKIKSVIETLAQEVDALQETDLFESFSLEVSNPEILQAEITGDVSTFEHEIIVNRLATFQRIRSQAFSSASEEVGTGVLKITLGSGPAVEIEISEENDTLSGIAKAINEADAGVKAQVVADGQGNFFLLLSAEETGAQNTISIEIDEDNDGVFNEDPAERDLEGLSRLAFNSEVENMVETQEAQDAELIFDGITVYRAKNTIEDLIDGIKINLQKAAPEESVRISSQRDYSKLEERLNSFVETFNQTMGILKELQRYDPANPENNGIFLGDNTVNLIRRRLQSITAIETFGAEKIKSLSDMGIVFNRDGFLEVDNDRLVSAIRDNFEDVKKIFTEDDGVFAKFEEILKSTKRLLKTKEEGLEKSLEHISERKERLEERIARYEERIRQQFNGLELLLAQYQKTSDYLGRQIEIWSSLVTGRKK